MIKAIVEKTRATICGGKAGDSALKFFKDGTFICPYDTCADNVKLLDESINSSGFKEIVKIGIVWDANDFWNEDKDGYELDNPKKPLDEE